MKDKPLLRAEACARAGCCDPRCKHVAVILIRPQMVERADDVLMPYVELTKQDVRDLIEQLTELERGLPCN